MAWTQQLTEDGHCYYENYITGESQWEKPDDWTEDIDDDDDSAAPPPPVADEEEDDDIASPPPPVNSKRSSSIFGAIKTRLSGAIPRIRSRPSRF
ncbi:hypothetical protein TrLO_g6568 [Triparma laevis f. longispina]|uniref:WW domain-containing protein n=1 Tax=Triparma laevis f. longispina TaxID=1714387 RepID=A0A9W7FCH0_9STRA|nr:hypothetical protein TrLO_g6568 [Triparma laevis f. longispina]